jgi:hypothetical protein
MLDKAKLFIRYTILLVSGKANQIQTRVVSVTQRPMQGISYHCWVPCTIAWNLVPLSKSVKNFLQEKAVEATKQEKERKDHWVNRFTAKIMDLVARYSRSDVHYISRRYLPLFWAYYRQKIPDYTFVLILQSALNSIIVTTPSRKE